MSPELPDLERERVKNQDLQTQELKWLRKRFTDLKRFLKSKKIKTELNAEKLKREILFGLEKSSLDGIAYLMKAAFELGRVDAYSVSLWQLQGKKEFDEKVWQREIVPLLKSYLDWRGMR